jgi:cell shape-determining protein MreC
MPRHWLTQKRLMIVLVLGLVVASLLPARTITPLARVPQQILHAAIRPPIRMLDAITPDLRSTDPRPIVDGASKPQLQQRLKDAHSYIASLESEVQRLKQAKRQLEQTQARTDRPVGLVAARVLSLSGSEVKPSLVIDRGRRAGLRSDLAVVYAGNLVGTVENVGPATATVRLILAARTGLQVRLRPNSPEPSGRQVIVRANVNEAQNAFFAEPGSRKPVEVGDLAHLQDSSWPPEAHGAIVGKVSSITGHPDEPLLINRVRIEPLVSLKQLDRVTVLVPKRQPTAREGRARR